MSRVCTRGPSLTQGGTGKGLLVCGDVEPNPGPSLGAVLPLTLARLASLALLVVGVGDLWLWATASLCAAGGSRPSLMRQGPVLSGPAGAPVCARPWRGPAWIGPGSHLFRGRGLSGPSSDPC